jgi:phosphate uptake regulator
MRRKLVKQGRNALTVTLPAKWIQQNNLSSGDEVEINEEGNELCVATEAKKAELKKTIICEDLSREFIQRIITNSYKVGVDELTLKFEKKLPINIIQSAVEKLTLGYEVTEIKDKYCIIGSFGSDEEEKLEITVRKCFYLIKECFNLLFEDLGKNKFESSDKIKSFIENTRKFINFSIRVSVKTVKDPKMLQHNSLIFSNLHLFAIKLGYIYTYLSEETAIPQSTKDILIQLQEMFNQFYDVYYKKELKSINKILKIKSVLVENIDKEINKKNGKVLLQVAMAMRCVHDSLGALTALLTG